SLRLETYTELTHLKSLSIAMNTLVAAGDLLIATTLCIVLHQSRTGFQRYASSIFYVYFHTDSVNTDLLTRLISSQYPIVLEGQTFFYIMFFFCIGRFYSNSLLATFNARKNIR
ncbi:hypothetical protein P691DRAFT_634705, partial [Macrolepiota fuliginosa MF-IS2]